MNCIACAQPVGASEFEQTLSWHAGCADEWAEATLEELGGESEDVLGDFTEGYFDPGALATLAESWAGVLPAVEQGVYLSGSPEDWAKYYVQALTGTSTAYMSYCMLTPARDHLKTARDFVATSRAPVLAPTTFDGQEAREAVAAAYEALGLIVAQMREATSDDLDVPSAYQILSAHGLAQWAAENGDLDEAGRMWKIAASQNQVPLIAVNSINSLVFKVLLPLQQMDEARVWLRRGVELNVGFQSANSLCNLGIVEFESGELADAREAFEGVLALPEGPFDEVRYYLDWIDEIEG